MPYNFNEKHEYKVYKKIGVDVKKLYRSQNNMIFRIFYRLKPKVQNKEYERIDTYSEWKNYVIGKNENKLAYDRVYFENFICFLIERKRKYKFEQNMTIGIMVPIYLALAPGAISILFPVLEELQIDKWNLAGCAWGFFGMILIAVLIVMYIVSSRRKKYFYFYKDYLDIIMELKGKG